MTQLRTETVGKIPHLYVNITILMTGDAKTNGEKMKGVSLQVRKRIAIQV